MEKPNKPIQDGQALLAGMQRAINKLIAQAKKNDEELVVVRDGKPVRMKARDL